MVSNCQRAAAGALGLAAAATFSRNHGVAAFYSGPSFAPQRVSWAAQQSLGGCYRVGSFSAVGDRGHRCYVRDRSGSKIGLGASQREDAAGAFAASASAGRAWGAPRCGQPRRDSRVWMVPEDGAASSGEAVEAFMPAPLQDALPEDVQAALSTINSDPAKLAFTLNAIVLFLFAAFAAFKLATVDGDIARGWTWYEIVLRVPGDNFYRYEATVSQNPIITKALTSCVAYGLGDLTAQLFTGKDLETIDLKRTGRSATAGLLIHGPLCHFWIELMQTYLDFDGAWWNFIPKVIADQTVWSVFLNAAYSTMIMALQGMSPENVWEQVKTTAWPALTSSWRFWPLIHCFSFSNVIPKDLKLLFIDCMEIIWVTILSTVANKDRQPDEDEGEAGVMTGEEPSLGAAAVLLETEREAEAVHN